MPRRVAPSSAAALLVVTAFLVAACSSLATPTPQAAKPTPEAFPEASFTGGTASASLELPAATAWAGGYCSRGADDAWLALNVGLPNGDEYFGLVVGRSPYTPAAVHSAAGGGTLEGGDVVLTWRHSGVAATPATAGLSVKLASSLARGSFSGHLVDGTEIRGTFSC